MRTLSARQLVVTRAAAAAIVAEEGRPVPAARLDAAVAQLGAYSGSVGWQTLLALRASLLVLQLSPLFLLWRPARFTHLAQADQLRCLTRLEAGLLGLMVVLLKTMVCLFYYEQPGALAATGYDAQGLLAPAHAPGASPLEEAESEPLGSLGAGGGA